MSDWGNPESWKLEAAAAWTAMPPWLQDFAQVLPLQAAVRLVRPLFLGGLDPRWPLHLAVLLAYLAAGWWLALVLTRRRFRA